MITKQQALDYHSKGKPGKIEVTSTKPCQTQLDLSLAYTPGVAQPCLEIHKNPADVYKYTAKGNLVAVVSNGTAVLGLGNIGAAAGKPVMEGKGVLFKRFADIDVFDIELNTENPDEIIKCCQLLEPTLGGINLEDIKAPECFYIEETLKASMNIPVFHDDQHGTAIISGAALLNALELVKKDISKTRVVFSGAGAAGIACAKLYCSLGVNPANILMTDSKGVIYEGRGDKFNKYKQEFVRKTDRHNLAEALKDADVFVGVSVANAVTQDMVKSMAKDPIIFAMANPDPEITYPDACAARKDVIMATGRSDYPNQVNNVLGFPFIFRGALDTQATAINEDMKIAAVHALASLAKEDVPDEVARAYGVERFKFGRDYIIPKPFDRRVLVWEASAIAAAAMKTGVARRQVDIEEYKRQLGMRIGRGRAVMEAMTAKARSKSKRVVFPEGMSSRILRAAKVAATEKIAEPILLGNLESIKTLAKELEINLDGIEIIDPATSPNRNKYGEKFYQKRQRHGVTLDSAISTMANPTYFGIMMLEMGDCDAVLSGVTSDYPTTMRPALQIIGLRPGVSRVSGLFAMIQKDKVYFFADTTVNVNPNAEELAEIAINAANMAKTFNIEPRLAMLSFSNFGSARYPESDKVAAATAIVRKKAPELIVDGEMQADTALLPELMKRHFPFSKLDGEANVFIFPDLNSGNIAYKLLEQMGGLMAVGPILMGLARPVHVLHRTLDVNQIIDMVSIAVTHAQISSASKT
ncbi:putative fused malic enzyme oxidoreductase; putative phosphotransacetylase [Candidatus Zixiibacteriota bacterium]|nr:putative fused malic enzyme oxidoreductase; putative phosphotransacetylase [candidate division Zixibacteria bacterium]